MEERIKEEYDAIIVGGGPAGTTTATLLAKRGYQVLLVDSSRKKTRFKSTVNEKSLEGGEIGESLIPYCNEILDEVGVWESMREDYKHKGGLLFPNPDGAIDSEVNFERNFSNPIKKFTLQVHRPDFDKRLRVHAQNNGVTLLEDRVQDFLWDGTRIYGIGTNNEKYLSRFVVDASGTGRLAAKQFGWIEKDEAVRAALFGHLTHTTSDAGKEGYTAIGFHPKSRVWSWFIPLSGEIASVGLVAPKTKIGEIRKNPDRWRAELYQNKWFYNHLRNAELRGNEIIACPFNGYKCNYAAAPGLVLVGDALYFNNPIFSTGVQIALSSGKFCADLIDRALKGNSESQELHSYAETVTRGLTAFDRIIRAFHDSHYDHRNMRNQPGFREHLNELLAGNAFDRDYKELYEVLEANGVALSEGATFGVWGPK